MPALTLSDYSGDTYDGSPDKFLHWEQTITTKLGAHRVAQCIKNEAYQGRDINGIRIEPGDFLDDQVEDGTDLQTVVGAYLIQSLSGSIRIKVLRARQEREQQPAGTRFTLTAFEIFELVKKEANPIPVSYTHLTLPTILRV